MSEARDQFSVLILCDANVCRSPVAEFVLSQYLRDARVESAGLRAGGRMPMCPIGRSELTARFPTSDAALEHFAGSFRSRPLREVVPAEFDLVLTATREGRGTVARSAPAALDRLFTVREAAALLSGGAVSDPRLASDPISVVAAMNARRDSVPMPPAERSRLSRPIHPFDISDQHSGTRRRHRSSVELVIAAASVVGEVLEGRAHPPDGPSGDHRYSGRR